ncbi:MAG TPA: DUF268 domain-containing protein [Gemmatimonadales bacterium]|nr:DUF268 domain-containing protein [Gemmatimonadales bacterium]
MTYCDTDTDFDAVSRHLRNKNLGVYPRRWTSMLKVAQRLYGRVARFRSRALRNAGWQAVVSEQIVENALILRHLKPSDIRVLDFGGYESLLPLTLSALGHEVTVLDQRPYPFKGPRLKSVTADIFQELPLSPESFDLVISVSTIEHLGLGGYEDARIPDGDRLGVARLWQLVRPGGRLIATLPAGQPTIQRGYRTYDEARLRGAFPPLDTVLWFKKDGRGGSWGAVDAAAVATLKYSDPFAEMPAEAVAFVVANKPLR